MLRLQTRSIEKNERKGKGGGKNGRGRGRGAQRLDFAENHEDERPDASERLLAALCVFEDAAEPPEGFSKGARVFDPYSGTFTYELEAGHPKGYEQEQDG